MTIAEMALISVEALAKRPDPNVRFCFKRTYSASEETPNHWWSFQVDFIRELKRFNNL
jgi:hypothetical protein